MTRGLLSLLAIFLAIPVLYGAISGRYSLELASVRLVVLAVGVGVLDRYGRPLVAAVLGILAGGAPEERSP